MTATGLAWLVGGVFIAVVMIAEFFPRLYPFRVGGRPVDANLRAILAALAERADVAITAYVAVHAVGVRAAAPWLWGLPRPRVLCVSYDLLQHATEREALALAALELARVKRGYSWLRALAAVGFMAAFEGSMQVLPTIQNPALWILTYIGIFAALDIGYILSMRMCYFAADRAALNLIDDPEWLVSGLKKSAELRKILPDPFRRDGHLPWPFAQMLQNPPSLEERIAHIRAR